MKIFSELSLINWDSDDGNCMFFGIIIFGSEYSYGTHSRIVFFLYCKTTSTRLDDKVTLMDSVWKFLNWKKIRMSMCAVVGDNLVLYIFTTPSHIQIDWTITHSQKKLPIFVIDVGWDSSMERIYCSDFTILSDFTREKKRSRKLILFYSNRTSSVHIQRII